VNVVRCLTAGTWVMNYPPYGVSFTGSIMPNFVGNELPKLRWGITPHRMGHEISLPLRLSLNIDILMYIINTNIYAKVYQI
jgi:hypothetical protein